MNAIKRYLYKRKVRRLAERILAQQIVYSDKSLQCDIINNAVMTAKKFYSLWEALME